MWKKDNTKKTMLEQEENSVSDGIDGKTSESDGSNQNNHDRQDDTYSTDKDSTDTKDQENKIDIPEKELVKVKAFYLTDGL